MYTQKAVLGKPEKFRIQILGCQQFVSVIHHITDTRRGVVIHQHHHRRDKANKVYQVVALMILRRDTHYSTAVKTICLVALRSYLPFGVRGNSPSISRKRVGTI